MKKYDNKALDLVDGLITEDEFNVYRQDRIDLKEQIETLVNELEKTKL